MKLIIGARYSEEIKELNKAGYEAITFDSPDSIDPETSNHADINVFKYNDKLIINNRIAHKIGESVDEYDVIPCYDIKSPYPHDVKLNCALIGDRLLCNTRFAAKELLNFAEQNNITLIHTNQGYSKCSVCVLNNNAVITEDPAIASLLKNYQIEVLLIEKGFVGLSSKHYGFIGGASGMLDDNTVYFSGDISKHPDWDKICKFLNSYNISAFYSTNRKLYDFGGFITL